MKNSRPWMNSDVAALRVGRQPHGRTYRACMMFCIRHGIPFPGKKAFEENKELDKKFTQSQGIIMTKSKPKTITASVKDAKAVKKPAAVKAAKPASEPEKAEERSYSFRTINVDNIVDSGNIREVKGIDDLIASIQAHGIINPITVTNDFGTSTNYRVLAGHRRLAAAVQLGLKKIPCHVVDKDQESIDEIQLSENVTRMDMTPYEECMAVKSLSNSKKTPAAIAKHFGRTLRWVLVRKKLADAGEKVLKKVKEGVIELAQAAKIADLPDNVFKRELESCYRTDKYFIDGVLDRFHKDLSRAQFEHESCLQCSKCSACQADLFENEPKAYCLDPNCWTRKAKKAAEAKVKKLQEEGRNARLGKFSSYGVDCMDEADKFEIGKYDTKGQDQAKEAGIQKRILVDAATLKTFEYFDKRDLPDYREETEEERQERETKEDENRVLESVKKDLFEENLANAICDKIEEDHKNGRLESLVFIMHFAQTDWLDNDEDLQKKIGIEKGSAWSIEPEDFPESYSTAEFTNTVIENIFDIIGNWPLDNLKGVYRIVMDEMDNDPEKLAPSDEEVEKEVAKRQTEKDDSDESDDDNEDNLENEEVDNE